MDDYPALHRYSDRYARRVRRAAVQAHAGQGGRCRGVALVRRAVARLERLRGPLHTILDVPVGTGRMAKRLGARGFQVTGLDASDDMLAVARSIDAAYAYQVGRAEHMPFEDRSFDAVVSVRLFGHLPSGAKAEVLAEFRRVARCGAVVFVPGQTQVAQAAPRLAGAPGTLAALVEPGELLRDPGPGRSGGLPPRRHHLPPGAFLRNAGSHPDPAVVGGGAARLEAPTDRSHTARAMSPATILIVEDDPGMRSMLVRGLREEGLHARGVETGTQLLEEVASGSPDLFIIDIGLPDADGRDVCQALRAQGVAAPVLFLTARDALPDRLSGFSAGGDDYLTKPFAFAELVARLEALLRRAGGEPALEVGELRLDPRSHSAVCGGESRGAHADRVPAAGAAGCGARRGGAPARPRRGRLAPRRHRPREHPRRLHRAPAPQAVGPSRRPGDRHRPRRGIPSRMRP